MALVLKKLVSRSSSVVVPNLRRSPNHPRHFIAEVGSILKQVPRRMAFSCPTDIAPEFFSLALYRVPHTLRVTSRVTGEEARGLSGGDVDTTLGSSMKFSLHLPGIEKITETPENVHVFIDMGLHKNWVDDDLDVNEFKATLQHRVGLTNVLSIEGYVQKLDIRRHYTAVICLPPNVNPVPNNNNLLVLPENGGMVVTIPKQQDKRFTTVDFKSGNSGREMHGHLCLPVEDYDKNFKVFLRGRVLRIIGDDGMARHTLAMVPTHCFKSSEVVAIKGRDEIKVIFPLTTEEVEHDMRIKVEVPFVV
ncbi:uncharacterized protein [Rutidosis leptorrhynchoides]|uniref:uncharacterized protein n=1 Tax=Rutidosis leptorrhynchoides TaxID=125765 RepID=UPI003A99A344